MSMDSDSEPCADFYQFACGNYVKNTYTKSGSYHKVGDTLYDTFVDEIALIIDEPISEGYFDATNLIRRFSKACLDELSIQKHSYTAIKAALREMGGWPILDGNNWRERDFDWRLATYKLKNLGYEHSQLVSISVVINEDDKERHVVKISESVAHLLNVTARNEHAYVNYLSEIAVLLGADINVARNGFIEVLQFQRTLEKVIEFSEKQNNSHHLMTISELQYQYPEFLWFEFINKILEPYARLNQDETVTVSSPSYLKQLNELLKITPKRVLANFLGWTTLSTVIPFMPRELRIIYTKLINELRPDIKQTTRKEECYEIALSNFEIVILREYVDRQFQEEDSKPIADMIKNIKNALMEVVENLEWIDDETRVLAIEKLASTPYAIGFKINYLPDKKEINSAFKNVKINDDEVLTSFLNAKRFQRGLELNKLHERVNKYDWKQVVSHTNGVSYNHDDNDDAIEVSYLQIRNFFRRNGPQFFNYGSLGFAIARQLFLRVFWKHIDCFDKKFYDWFSTHSLVNYHTISQCVSEHYRHYYLPEINKYLNSTSTRDQDIADLAGVALAYQAYIVVVGNSGEEEEMPGMQYTPNQLFWLSFAQTQCAKYSAASLDRKLEDGCQSPEKYRVLGAMKNLHQFANDYNCPAQSLMNPENKCNIW